MAKEDDLKIIELKVSVNCCEGCKRKVLKALSIKGVLKAEIHPTLPKVTVLGTVDVQTLIKKLAKCGKTAEVCHLEGQKQALEEKRPEDSKKEVDTGVTNGKGKANESNETKKPSSEPAKGSATGDGHTSNLDGISVGDEGSRKKGSKAATETVASGESSLPDAPKSVYPTVATAIPPVSCVINQGMMQSPPAVMASHARLYYPMEPYTVHPMGYYTVSTYSTPPPCCVPDHHQCECPMYRPPPPPPAMHSQPPSFADYFNDENTVGCRIM